MFSDPVGPGRAMGYNVDLPADGLAADPPPSIPSLNCENHCDDGDLFASLFRMSGG